MNKRDRFMNTVSAVVLDVIGLLYIVASDESRNPIACVCFGLFCLAVAHFVLGYMNGRR